MSQSQAVLLLLKAQKKLNTSPGWFTFGSNNSQFEESGDLFQQAANQFKIEKRFKEAGDAFKGEAECREKMNEANEASNAWWNAAKAYKQGYPELAIDAFSHAITNLTKAGRFRQAADREKEIAQIYLNELGDMRKSCESYERAAEWYQQEDATATANNCFKEAADLYAELHDYARAIHHYELVADASLSSNLTKYSVKEYWLRAGLCAVAEGDIVKARRQTSIYANKDVTFTSTREYKFLVAVIDARESEDEQALTDAAVDFDSVVKLDNFKTKVLLDIKTKIQESGGDFR